MTASTDPKPYTDLQKKAMVTQLFRQVHVDMGAILRDIVSDPQESGYAMSTDKVASATTKIMRAQVALDKLGNIFQQDLEAAVAAAGEGAPSVEELTALAVNAQGQSGAKSMMVGRVTSLAGAVTKKA